MPPATARHATPTPEQARAFAQGAFAWTAINGTIQLLTRGAHGEMHRHANAPNSQYARRWVATRTEALAGRLAAGDVLHFAVRGGRCYCAAVSSAPFPHTTTRSLQP